MTAPPLVTDQPGLAAALRGLADLDPVGVDVERADSENYWRRAALIQVGGDGRGVLLDPLALTDLAPLDTFLQTRTVVLHAMENDLVPLAAAGVKPPRVEDTAVAAALLGLPTGLEALLAQILGVELPPDKEAMQRADWAERPLDAAMRTYAIADVTDLPALWTALAARLDETGRRAWYEEEIARLRSQPSVEDRRDWSRLKGIGRLNSAALGRAKALWEARETLARDSDTAPGRIVADRVLLGLAEEPPANARELGRRGVRRRAVREFGEAIVGALRSAHPAPRPSRGRRVTDDDKATADRLRTVRAEVAHQLELDPGVLCPSRVLLTAVMSDPGSPEQLRAALDLRDWQWELLADPFCEALGLSAPGTPDGQTTGTAESTPHRDDQEDQMADVLDTDSLESALGDLPGWAGSPESGISKTFKFADFAESIAFVNRIAPLADAADHHPDLTISWNKVTVTYITHSVGGVTAADVEQAQVVEDRAT